MKLIPPKLSPDAGMRESPEIMRAQSLFRASLPAIAAAAADFVNLHDELIEKADEGNLNNEDAFPLWCEAVDKIRAVLLAAGFKNVELQ